MEPTAHCDSHELTKRSRIAAAMLSPFPTPLLSDVIVGYLLPPLPDREDTVLNGFSAHKHMEQVQRLSLVCKDWHTALLDVVNKVQRLTRRVVFVQTVNREDQVIRATQELRASGGEIIQLKVVVLKWSVEDPLTRNRWQDMFRCMPSLVRLDLHDVSDSIVCAFVAAASRVCPHVKDLALCGGLTWDPEGFLPSIFTESLQRWYDASGGLRALTVPCWALKGELCVTFLEAVANYCPLMEYLRPHPLFYVSRAPRLRPEMWTLFCRQCPKIKTFTDTPGVFAYHDEK